MNPISKLVFMFCCKILFVFSYAFIVSAIMGIFGLSLILTTNHLAFYVGLGAYLSPSNLYSLTECAAQYAV